MLQRLMDKNGIGIKELANEVGLPARAVKAHMEGFCMSDGAARIYARVFDLSLDKFLES